MPLSRLSLNTATVRAQWNLAQCIEGCARHGFGGIAPWRDKLAELGTEVAARQIRDAGLRVSGLCRGGMFPAADAAGRKAAAEDNLRALDEAVAIGAECLVLVVGGLPAGSRNLADARAQVEDGIAALLEAARPAGMPLAIEPLHPMYAADRACVNTMAQARGIWERLGEGVTVAVDVYHVWWDPDLRTEIAAAGSAGRIAAFHVCDWLVPTRDLLLDRGMMGDGVIEIPQIRRWVEDTGFDGMIEVEIFSEANWWKRDADEVMEVVKTRYLSAV
ncbi:sugar phosphate isomerase/epimerase family protein [Oceanibacterium hippocampi]|uniref:sugar phosphate isomerase/epimerase family protein n=1 Tax=Oceanibacterium hippocampi TaxID=745714 RepID=UPI000A269AF5